MTESARPKSTVPSRPMVAAARANAPYPVVPRCLNATAATTMPSAVDAPSAMYRQNALRPSPVTRPGRFGRRPELFIRWANAPVATTPACTTGTRFEGIPLQIDRRPPVLEPLVRNLCRIIASALSERQVSRTGSPPYGVGALEPFPAQGLHEDLRRRRRELPTHPAVPGSPLRTEIRLIRKERGESPARSWLPDARFS